MIRRIFLSIAVLTATATFGYGEDLGLAVLKGHGPGPVWMNFAPDGKSLVSAGSDGTIRLWDVSTGQQLATVGDGKWKTTAFRVAPDSKSIVTIRDGKVYVFKTADKSESQFSTIERLWATAIQFNPDGSKLAIGYKNGTLKIHDSESGQEVANCGGHTGAISNLAVAFSSDGKILATGSADHTVRIWTVANGVQRHMVPKLRNVTSLRFIERDTQLIFLDSIPGDEVQRAVDVRTGKEPFAILAPMPKGGVSGMAPALDGQLVLSIGREDWAPVTAWDPKSHKSLPVAGKIPATQFRALKTQPMVLSVYGTTIQTSRLTVTNGKVQITRVKRVQDEGADLTSLAVSCDESVMATADKNGVIKVWDVKRMVSAD